MNGVLDRQTSGNDWTPDIGPMLHERPQEQIGYEALEQQRIIFDDFEAQMRRYEADHRAMLAEVARCYVVPRDNSVQNFLNTYRSVPPLLLQAYPRLREQFTDAVLALRANSDENGWQNLCVDALWQGNSADAYAAIDRFEDAWWVANSHMAAGHLMFTYRLI
jgi:hypothetical protein